jgi:hypothetical protein
MTHVYPKLSAPQERRGVWARLGSLISATGVELGQFQIGSVNFVGTQVTYKESRTVGGKANPGASSTTLEPRQSFQIDEQLRASLPDLDAPKGGMIAKRYVVVKVVPVRRPVGKSERCRFGDPVRPFLGLEIEQAEFL